MLKIFIVEDDPFYARLLVKAIESEDYEIIVYASGAELLSNLHQNPDIITLDFNLPDSKGSDLLVKIKEFNPEIPVVAVSGQEDVNVVVEAYKLGVNHYIIKNSNAMVELSYAVSNISKSLNLQREVESLRDNLIDRNKYSSIIGESKAILKVLRLVQKIEKSNILTLITGESGTGKEVIAKAIHYHSMRSRKPFVAVNLAAIPEDLIESELFGHEKGAFTGAIASRKGKFEEAHEGTIFLDEIGEMDISMQTKLLRVLQEGQISRLGSNKVINLNVRVLTATNKNLSERVKQGKFREDLYYRIQGFLIPMPPLRDRGNDVILLAQHFLSENSRIDKSQKKTFTKSALKMLIQHPWPGNIRELKSVVDRATLISDTHEITDEDLIFSDAI